MNIDPAQLERVCEKLAQDMKDFLRDRGIEPHYSAATVAELLELSERTIWNYVEEGEATRGKDGIYPVIKLSHKNVRIPASSVKRFLKSKTITVPGKEAA